MFVESLQTRTFGRENQSIECRRRSSPGVNAKSTNSVANKFCWNSVSKSVGEVESKRNCYQQWVQQEPEDHGSVLPHNCAYWLLYGAESWVISKDSMIVRRNFEYFL